MEHGVLFDNPGFQKLCPRKIPPAMMRVILQESPNRISAISVVGLLSYQLLKFWHYIKINTGITMYSHRFLETKF